MAISLDAFSRLGVLQGALATAIQKIPSTSVPRTLFEIRGIRMFEEIGDLRDLISQDHLTRLAINPVLYGDVARVLRLDPEIGRNIFQMETRPERLLPAYPYVRTLGHFSRWLISERAKRLPTEVPPFFPIGLRWTNWFRKRGRFYPNGGH